MRLGIATLSVAVLGLSGCDTLKAVTENPNCVTRVSGQAAFGGGVPTGTTRFSTVCNAPVKPKPEDVPPPPAEDKAP